MQQPVLGQFGVKRRLPDGRLLADESAVVTGPFGRPSVICSFCGRDCRTEQGLSSHMRKHARTPELQNPLRFPRPSEPAQPADAQLAEAEVPPVEAQPAELPPPRLHRRKDRYVPVEKKATRGADIRLIRF